MASKQQKILGIDYGDQRVGLALAEAKSIAVPYKVIENNTLADLLQQLQEIIQTEQIEIIVVGLPYSLSGKENERLNITQKFIQFLKDNLNIPIKTIDERLSSKLYTKMGVRQELDKHAATAILDTFLAQKND